MTKDQYQELVEFVAGQFERTRRESGERFDRIEERLGGVEERLTGVEGRLTSVEIRFEALRDDLRAVAEGVTTNGARIDRLTETVDGHTGRFDRLEATIAARFDDHERRIRVLEN